MLHPKQNKIKTEISKNSSRHLQNQRPTVIIAVVRAFLNPKGQQTVLSCHRLGKGLDTREHLFVSAKINYIFGYSAFQL
jgi:hypothetical protein